jgi:voltage-gated potassium channel
LISIKPRHAAWRKGFLNRQSGGVRRSSMADTAIVAAKTKSMTIGEGGTALAAGHFFGEITVLRKAQRSATVRAMTRTSLLVLDARDVHTLMDHEPRIAERIHETARQRSEPEPLEPRGDLAAEELVAADADTEPEP